MEMNLIFKPNGYPGLLALLLAFLLFDPAFQGAGAAVPCNPQRYARERERMVRDQIRARGIRDESVLRAMREVPRHCFVPAALVDEAYDDHPLPIGMGQTVSQPYVVALMTEALELKPTDRVLEVGTGSGYQAAILSVLVERVFSVEIRAPLARRARVLLASLGYNNVVVKHGDGHEGWKAYAPFDAILVTAASEKIPLPLIRQLKPGGRLCIPVGGRNSVQYLTLVEKATDGSIRTRRILPVRFVPLQSPRETE